MGSGVRAPVIQSSLGAAAYSLIFLLLAIAPGSAQSPPPLPGFVPPFEITRIVRTAGFDPMARPLREGTTYVVRATDFRGILMRVVVDARSGAIRAVNRIVSDQGMYGALGVLPPLSGVPQPYSGTAAAYAPPEFEVPDIAPNEAAAVPAGVAPFNVRTSSYPLVSEPPLPRPRPRAAALAARRTSWDAKPAVRPSARSAVTAAPAVPALQGPSPVQLPD